MMRLAVCLYLCVLVSVSLRAQQPAAAPQPGNALPAVRTGAQIYEAACATCHAPDGRGTPKPAIGFDVPIRDFTDCTASAEPSPDWAAVVHEGGPVRALDRHMPAFGDALSADDIDKVVDYLRDFCAEKDAWPIGDLNFPRAFFTEKAYPENETVLTSNFATGGDQAIGNELVYERRIGARNQIEVIVPVDFQQQASGQSWVKGIGDLAFAMRRTFFANVASGTIAAAGAEVILPTGNADKGLGNGYTVFEPFAMWGQALPRDSYFQMHGGIEIPSDGDATKEAYLRTAIGTTFAQDRGFGRAWSPQVEVLWARPFGEESEWDVVPQIQVSLSKLQHVLIAGGVRVPLTQREERHPQVLVYFLWDWFDGGLFSFWK
jgi:mono/diheme cytochrome c family protein